MSERIGKATVAAKHMRSGDALPTGAQSKDHQTSAQPNAARHTTSQTSVSGNHAVGSSVGQQRTSSRQHTPRADSAHSRGQYRGRHDASRAAASDDQLARYRRDANPNYTSGKRKLPLWKRALIAVGVFLLCFVCATGAYAIWYSGQLDRALSMGEETNASVDDVLVSPIAGEPFYMLLLGSDSREGSGTSDKEAESGDNQRSDVMILARIDAGSKQVSMVTIPRDTPLTLEDGTMVKMNEAYNIGGPAYSIKAVSELTGVPITHYAEVHFSEFQELVDKLGGVEVDVPVELSYKDALTGETVTLQPGEQTLDGQQAQIFARARHEYGSDQDAQRQSSIRQLLEAIITKVLEKPFYELPNTVLDLADSIGTDLSASDLVALAMEYAGGSGSMTMYSCTGPSDGDINPNAGGIWLCYENPEGWANLMSVVDAGEDPSGLDVESTAIIPAEA